MSYSVHILSLPPPGWLKVNADGTLLPSNKVDIGALIRDDKGDVVVAMRIGLHY